MSSALPSVEHVDAINLYVDDAPWAYSQERADAIDANWRRAVSANPKYFNGAIFLMRRFSFEGGVFVASFLRTDFKSYLYWRQEGFEPAGVWDGFGSAIIRSADGGVILGRQASGNVNAGLAYMPGGFIDERDVGADGRVDIVGSVRREVFEETGLDTRHAQLEPGFLITRHGTQVSLGVVFQFDMSTKALCDRVSGFIDGEENSELCEVVAVTRVPCGDGAGFAPYAVTLLHTLLGSGE